MPNINDAFPSKYIRASDLHGAQPVVTIDRVDFEEVGKDKEVKPIVYFRGKEKGLVLNRTNAKKIVELLGSGDTDNWLGRAIRLYAAEVQYGAETMEGIRVKAANTASKPVAAPPPPPPPNPDGDEPDDDSVPF